MLARLIAHPAAERLVTTLIILNAVTLGLETSPAVMAAIGPLLEAADTAFLAFFTVEIAARIAVQRAKFFRDPWNVFDFLVVGISLVPASEGLSVLRALRVLRVLRLVTVVPSLRTVVGALVGALPAMGSIVLLLGLVFYVFGVMATKLFGETHPQLFGTLGESVLTLFQVMTLDAWSDAVMRPVSEKHPYAWIFFVPFVLVTAFTVLNLFIGVVVSAIETERDEARAHEAHIAGPTTEAVSQTAEELARLSAHLRLLSKRIADIEEAGRR